LEDQRVAPRGQPSGLGGPDRGGDDQAEPERKHGERLAHAAARGDPGNAGRIRQWVARVGGSRWAAGFPRAKTARGRVRSILTPASPGACLRSGARLPRRGLRARCEGRRMAAMTIDTAASLVLVVDDSADAAESLALVL